MRSARAKSGSSTAAEEEDENESVVADVTETYEASLGSAEEAVAEGT